MMTISWTEYEGVFQLGQPLTDEELHSNVQSKGASLEGNGGQPWESQPHSGLLAGDNLPDDKNNDNKNVGVKWPNALIPYVISSTFTAGERRTIASAMNTFHQKTCIRFVPRRVQGNYVKIIRSRESTTWANYPGCWAQKGQVGGAQELSLDNGCVTTSTVVHELVHALGFNHEQERPDQRDHISVRYANIARENRQWFTPKRSDAINSVGRYDINSVMHYHARAFAIDPSRPTMVARNGQTNMGNDRGLTSMDVQKLNAVYSGSGK